LVALYLSPPHYSNRTYIAQALMNRDSKLRSLYIIMKPE